MPTIVQHQIPSDDPIAPGEETSFEPVAYSSDPTAIFCVAHAPEVKTDEGGSTTLSVHRPDVVAMIGPAAAGSITPMVRNTGSVPFHGTIRWCYC